jgi:type II secretory pathway component GspD/PulD (secretin)
MRTKPPILLAICALTIHLLAGALFAADKAGEKPAPTPKGMTPGRVDIVPPPVMPSPEVTPRPAPATPKPTPAIPVTPRPTPAVPVTPPPTPVAKKPAPASAERGITPTPSVSPAGTPTPAAEEKQPAPVSPAPTPSPAAVVSSPSDDTTPGPVSEGAGAGEAAKPGGEKTASVLYTKPTPISILIDDVKDQTGVKIVLCGKSSALKIPYSGSDLTAEAFLNSISGANKLRWRKVPDGYELWDEESYNNEVTPKLVQQKVFVPVYVSAKYLYEAIKGSNVLTPKVGNVAVDERTNKVMVSDLPEKLALVQDMVNLLDEPQFTRVFYVRYAVIKDVVEKIKQFKSEAGTIEFDEIAHLIIVRDIMANIQRMETMIDLLDVRQIGRVYNLNSIGLGAKDLDKLQKNLELLITKSAFMMIDDARGLLILRDTPEVHEDVVKFLQVFDRPIDQVRIEAELLDVDQSSGFSYGMEYAVSGDLPSAVADGLIPNLGDKGTVPGNPFGFVNYKNEFPLGTAGNGGLSVSYLSSRIKAQLSAAMSDVSTLIVSQPRVIVKNREKVTLNDTKSVPIAQINLMPSGYYGTGGTATSSAVGTMDAVGGLKIEIEPTIAPTGLVEMTVFIENSTVEPVTLQSGLAGQTVQGVNRATDSIDTVLIIPDGETRVISGLIHRSQGDTKSGVPYLMKIPVVGPFLFGKTDKKERVRNLLFFVTPTILREQPKGKLIAYEFDQMPTTNKWESSEVPVAPGATPGWGEGGPAEDLTTTGTQRHPRFHAPTPDEFRNKLEEGKTTITLPIPLPMGKVDNSPEGLARALRAGGGALPDFAQDQKAGFSGEFKTPVASPAGPTAAPGAAQPGVTRPAPAAKPPVAAGPPAPTPPGARPGSGAPGAEPGGPRPPRVAPIPVLEPVIPPPVAPAQPETRY